jgi:RHS repeat-associated protein
LYLGGFEIYREFRNGGIAVELERETLHIMDDQRRIALVEARTRGSDKSPPQLVRYQLDNHLGSAALELDDKAQIISYEEYTPFGSTAYQAVGSQTETPKRYRYSGKERDDSTGLYYYGFRYYAPWLGRWMSPDPAGTIDGLNLYAFVGGNPIRFRDHRGLWRIFGSSQVAPAPAAPPAPVSPNPAQQNARGNFALSSAQIAATSAVSALSHTAPIAAQFHGSAGNVVGVATAMGIAAPLGLLGALRTAKQGWRAAQRLKAIRDTKVAHYNATLPYAIQALHNATFALPVQHLHEDRTNIARYRSLRTIETFVERKTEKRVKRMEKRTALSAVGVVGATMALAGGIVTPVGAAGLLVGAGAGAAGAAYSGFFAVKGIGKMIGRSLDWMPNERHGHAEALYDLAITKNFGPAQELLNAMDVTKKMPIEVLRQNPAGGIAYIKQKMRS